MPVLAFLRQHLREGGHHIQMQPVDLVIEALRLQGSLRPKNRHGVFNVLFFQCFASTLLVTSTPILRPSAANAAACPCSPCACSNASAISAGSSHISDKE